MKRLSRLAILFLTLAAGARGAEEVPLINPASPLEGWKFDHGGEFPGAKGGIALDETAEPQRRPAMRLDGDFTGGGNY